MHLSVGTARHGQSQGLSGLLQAFPAALLGARAQVKAACEREKGADCQMGGFTRILHSGKPDDLMAEIPTVVVEPLPDKENKGCGTRLRARVGGRDTASSSFWLLT